MSVAENEAEVDKSIFGEARDSGVVISGIIAAALSSAANISYSKPLTAVLEFLALKTALPAYEGLSAENLGLIATAYANSAGIYEFLPDYIRYLFSSIANAVQVPNNPLLFTVLLKTEETRTTKPLMAATIYGLFREKYDGLPLENAKKKELLSQIIAEIPDLGPKSRTIKQGPFNKEKTHDITPEAVRNASLAAIVAYMEAKKLGDDALTANAIEKLMNIAKNISLEDDDDFKRYYETMIYALRDVMTLYYDPENNQSINSIADILGLMGKIGFSEIIKDRFDKTTTKPADTDALQISPLLKCLRTLDTKILLKFITNRSQVGKDTNIVPLIEAVLFARSYGTSNVASIIKGNLELVQSTGQSIDEKLRFLVNALLRGWPFTGGIISLLPQNIRLIVRKELEKQKDKFSIELLNTSMNLDSFRLSVLADFPYNMDLNQMIIYVREAIKVEESGETYGSQLGDKPAAVDITNFINETHLSLKKIVEVASDIITNRNKNKNNDSLLHLQQILEIMSLILPDSSIFDRILDEKGITKNKKSYLDRIRNPFIDFAKTFAGYLVDYAINEANGENFASILLQIIYSRADKRLVEEIITQIKQKIINNPDIYYSHADKINALFIAIGLPNDSIISSRVQGERDAITKHAQTALLDLVNTVCRPAHSNYDTAQKLLELGEIMSPEEYNQKKRNSVLEIVSNFLEHGSDTDDGNYRSVMNELQAYLNSLYTLQPSFISFVTLCKIMGLNLGDIVLTTFILPLIKDKIADIKSFTELTSEIGLQIEIHRVLQEAAREIELQANIGDTEIAKKALTIAQRIAEIARLSRPASNQTIEIKPRSTIPEVANLIETIKTELTSGTRVTISENIVDALNALIPKSFSANSVAEVNKIKLQNLASQLNKYKQAHIRIFGSSSPLFDEIINMISQALEKASQSS